MSHLMNTYARLPIAFERGEGAWLWDTEGKRYLDTVSGVAVNGLGHAHPKLISAIHEQSKKLIHCSNLYQVPLQESLGTKLCTLSKMDNAFFCNSGAEANEAAIKLARLYGHQKGIDLPTIIVMEKSFHGRTMATLSATGNRKVQAGFEPLLAGFARVPYNDIPAVEQVAAHNKNIVAVMVEPYQGEGGVQIPEADYLSNLRKICDRHGWLLILDEVQSGIARTGTWFAFQHGNLLPDVMTLAKGLGSGFPIGACLARGQASTLFKPGNHGSTFGGNPLACSAALATLAAIEEENLIGNAKKIGEFLKHGFQKMLEGVAGVVEIRGQGLLIGIELDRNCTELPKIGLAQGIVVNVTSEKVLRLIPALVMNQSEAETVLEKVSALIRKFLSNRGSYAA